jgi:hypothetical protein
LPPQKVTPFLLGCNFFWWQKNILSRKKLHPNKTDRIKKEKNRNRSKDRIGRIKIKILMQS